MSTQSTPNPKKRQRKQKESINDMIQKPVPQIEKPETAEDVLERNLANVQAHLKEEAAKEDDERDDYMEEETEDMSPEYEMFMRGKSEEAMQQMKLLLDVMSPEQLRRYETYRSAAFPKAAMKKILQQMLNQTIPERLAVMVAGVVKLHVGQLIEVARDIMIEGGENPENPVRPQHLREAARRMTEQTSKKKIVI